MDINSFDTGYRTAQGDKIYLGDKIRGKFFFPMVVQYEIESQSFVLVSQSGKSPYRKYLLSDVQRNEWLNVVSNGLFFVEPKLGDKVKITVDNKGTLFPFGEMVEIIEVIDDWTIKAKLLDNDETTSLKIGEFIEDRQHK